MRAILYLQQILFTRPHLKKYYFLICAKSVELARGLPAEGRVLQGARACLWGAPGLVAQAEIEEGGWKPAGHVPCVALAVTVCDTLYA